MSVLDEIQMTLYNMSSNCSTDYWTAKTWLFANETNCSTGADESSGDSSNTFFGPPPLIVEFAKVLYGLVGLLGLCGNTLVIYVVLRFSKMQTVTNTYLLNLALADEMFLSGLPFLLTTMVYESWPFGSTMCKLYMTTTSINQFTSSLLLTVMSADRYVAVCHPIQSPRFRTAFVAKFVCLTAWTVSALLMVPIFMFASTLETGPYVSCNIYWPESSYMNGEMAFMLYAFTLGFAIPLVLILVFYFLVICKLRRVGPKNRSKEKKRTHRKVTRLVLTVVSVYVACWLPYWCMQVWLTFMPPESGQNVLSFTLMLLTGCLSYANSAVNPVLYAFLSDNFRKSFAKAFTCASGREVNAQLNAENSAFPRSTKGGSSRAQKQQDRGKIDSSTQASGIKTKLQELNESTMMRGEKEGPVRNGLSKYPPNSEDTQV